jgi:tetratricopeptide (TPR) repeat protein
MINSRPQPHEKPDAHWNRNIEIPVVLLAPPALAATMQDLADCLATTIDDARIAAFTLVIEDKATPDYDRAMAVYNRGTAYQSKDAYHEALADFNELLKGKPIGVVYAEPANPFALMVRGNVYPAKGDLNRAIDDYTAAIHFEPFAQYFHERGVAYRMKGDREHAIDDFKYAVHLLPKDTPRLARRTQGARDRHVRLRPYKATQGHAQFA